MNTSPSIRKRFALLAVVTLAIFATACGTVSKVKTPTGFVALSDDQIEWKNYQWKAVSPDGAVVILREVENEQEGAIDFWSEALERDIIANQGYKHIETTDVEAANLSGKLMRFEALYGGLPYRYNVAIFVTDDWIITVETAASEEVYERHQEALENAIRSTRLK